MTSPLPVSASRDFPLVGGRYQLEREVAQGAFGRVFSAIDQNTGDRVALKLLAATSRDSRAFRRLQREAVVLQRQTHDNLIRVVGSGNGDDGTPYIALEWVDGVDLATLLATQGAPPPAVCAKIALHLALALDALHEAGVVHRDVKPANAMLGRCSDGLVIKLVDLGIARLLDHDGTALTAARGVLGSLAYMAPEQIEHPAQVDARADVWSLGVLLYELLHARLPFIASDRSELANLILTHEPTPCDANLPAGMRRIIEACVRKNPIDRPSSARLVADDLLPFTNAANDEIARWLDTASSVASLIQTADEVSRATSSDDHAHTMIAGRYLLGEELGRGARGVVYACRDELLNAERAIKRLVLDAGPAGDQHAIRLVREARALGTLQHPNVVRVFDVGVDDDDQPFMVVEQLRGSDLSRVLEHRAPLAPGAVMTLLLQITDGLAAAHDNGILHRDIKPANVFLHNEGPDTVVVKLIDFGLVKQLSSDLAAAGQESTQGIVGTPAYMSPEQILGRTSLDGRTDVWGASVIAYQALSGVSPWPDARTTGELLVAIAQRDARPLEEIAPWVPHSIVELVHRGLSRNLETRWPNATEMARAIRSLAPHTSLLQRDLESLPEQLRSPFVSTTTRRSAKRNAWIGATLVGSILLAVGAWRSLSSSPQVTPSPLVSSVISAPSMSTPTTPDASEVQPAATLSSSPSPSADPTASTPHRSVPVAPSSGKPVRVSGTPPNTTAASSAPTAAPPASSGRGLMPW